MSSVSKPGLVSPGSLCSREVESFMEFTQSSTLEAVSDTMSSVKSSGNTLEIVKVTKPLAPHGVAGPHG